MDEAVLLEKLRLIEALFAGATTAGERVAAAEARRRIQARLGAAQKLDPPVESRFTMADAWSRRVFLALLHRYGLRACRYHGQRRTTVMVRAPKGFVTETLWPEFEQPSQTLRTYLDEITSRVEAQVIHEDSSEESEVAGTRQLGAGPVDHGRRLRWPRIERRAQLLLQPGYEFLEPSAPTLELVHRRLQVWHAEGDAHHEPLVASLRQERA